MQKNLSKYALNAISFAMNVSEETIIIARNVTKDTFWITKHVLKNVDQDCLSII